MAGAASPRSPGNPAACLRRWRPPSPRAPADPGCRGPGNFLPRSPPLGGRAADPLTSPRAGALPPSLIGTSRSLPRSEAPARHGRCGASRGPHAPARPRARPQPARCLQASVCNTRPGRRPLGAEECSGWWPGRIWGASGSGGSAPRTPLSPEPPRNPGCHEGLRGRCAHGSRCPRGGLLSPRRPLLSFPSPGGFRGAPPPPNLLGRPNRFRGAQRGKGMTRPLPGLPPPAPAPGWRVPSCLLSRQVPAAPGSCCSSERIWSLAPAGWRVTEGHRGRPLLGALGRSAGVGGA